MKKIYLLLTLALMGLTLPLSWSASASLALPAATTTEVAPAEDGKSWKDMGRKEKRSLRKQLKADLKAALNGDAPESGVATLLLVIIAVLLPPLAMLLYDGLSSRFWISLLLTLLFYLPGLIYTLVVILGNK